jgi:acetyl esterase/lipase
MLHKTELEYDANNHLFLDAYHDDAQPYLGLLIDIHGGGWFRGDKDKDADWATRLAQLGYEVLVPNYRLTPQVFYPEPLHDMDTLMTWIATSDFNQMPIGVVGSSAGGNMAVELAIRYGVPAVSLSGILDIDDWLAQHQAVEAASGDLERFNQQASAAINQTGSNDAFYKWFVLNYFNQRTDELRAATPVHRINATTGPLFLANSLAEFVPTSGVLKLADALTVAQVPFVLNVLSGNRHAKGYLDDIFPQITAFLATYLVDQRPKPRLATE